MQDSELFELVNFHPKQASWIQEMFRRDLGGTYGNEPKEHWCRWATDFLLEPPKERDGVDVLLRLLTLAESLYPGGMERTRLEESLGYLFNRTKGPYGLSLYTPVCITAALQEKVIREDTVDIWGPGMRSGTGLRTYYRRTLLGKSKVDISDMPPVYSEPATPYVPKAERLPVSPTPQTAEMAPKPATKIATWWRPIPAQPADPPAASNSLAPESLPDDFVWQKPYVNQQVSYFFKRHAKLYSAMALDVLNAKVEMNQFASEFGPAKISRWINEKHHVQSDHPNPCKPQNINSSATYVACVKSFKLNPDKHPIAKLLYQAESKEVEDILQELLGGGDSPA